MSGVNKVILIGRLGKDPEVRNLDNGATVANFSMATSEVFRDRTTGEKRENTEWHNIVLWRGLAEVAQKYLHKGDMVYIEGKLRTRSWEKDGITRYMTEVVGDNMTMLSPKGSGSQQHAGTGDYASSADGKAHAEPQPDAQPGSPGSGADASTDDLPF